MRTSSTTWMQICIYLVAVITSMVLYYYSDENGEEELTADEFECVAPFVEGSFSGKIKRVEDIDIQSINENDSVITIESFYRPLVLSSLTKNLEEFTENHPGCFSGLFKWKTSREPWSNFAASQFRAFLPLNSVQIGNPYVIIQPNLAEFDKPLSSCRYWYRPVEGNEVFLVSLLRLFHQWPFLHTRFNPQGTVAVVRAENNNLLDIVFRMHAEFQLNEPPLYPFWFTPSQFKGRVILSRDSSAVHYFQLYIPINRKLNIDLEWLDGPKEPENMEVDIGFIPQMELRSTAPSVPATLVADEVGKIHDMRQVFLQAADNYDDAGVKFPWQSEISVEEAYRILDEKMYPFKQVSYHSFVEAFELAEKLGKLVHSIVLWGALDDQSC